jgi:uncharacterized membrane protein YtjA (UPF0391 family)
MSDTMRKDLPMLGLALLFFLVAIIAAVFGFGVIAGTAATIARFGCGIAYYGPPRCGLTLNYKPVT